MQIYDEVCKEMKIIPNTIKIPIESYSSQQMLAQTDRDTRMNAALQVLIECLNDHNEKFQSINTNMIDKLITKIDYLINKSLDEVLHNKSFQALESTWKGLQYLLNKIDTNANIKIELLDTTIEELSKDISLSNKLQDSGLYDQIYTREYDTPGGEPYSAIVADFYFDASTHHINILESIGAICETSHAPLITAISPAFFNKDHFHDVLHIENLDAYLNKAEYSRWNNFRNKSSARYIALTFPKMLLRLPYGSDNPTFGINYTEHSTNQDHQCFLWGNASFAFAANLAESFYEFGWCLNIRGPESGGKVSGLPIPIFKSLKGYETKIPTETLIPETKELALANLGFIPLCYYKNSEYACFFSANSTHNPAEYLSKSDRANHKINARIPYLMLTSRVAHYLKVLQRENIGSNKSAKVLHNELTDWLNTLVTKMNTPDPLTLAKHPLKEAQVHVKPNLDNPGYFNVTLTIVPHIQVEGMDITLSLVSKMPGDTTNN